MATYPGGYYAALTNQSEDTDTRLTEQQKEATRKVVAGWVARACPDDPLADQVALAEDLMGALGVHPAQVDDDDYQTVYRTLTNTAVVS